MNNLVENYDIAIVGAGHAAVRLRLPVHAWALRPSCSQ